LGSNIWYFAGHIITVNGRIPDSKYVDILGNQVHPKFQMLFATIMQHFKMTIRQYTQPEVFILGLMSKKMHFNNFPG